MSRSLRTLIYTSAAGIVLFLLAVGTAYFEYRTNTIARALGVYLADNNASRASTGRLWELITSEAQARETLPDSLSNQTLPTDIPLLVQTLRLSIERIPEDGLPGYFAILTQPVPAVEREIVDARRLVEGVRIHRIGRSILELARLDSSPFRLEARSRAEAMGREIEAAHPAEIEVPLVSTDALERDTAGHPADTVGLQADTVGTLPADTIAASVVETFLSVILEEKVASQKRTILADWDDGKIGQVFVNRALGDYQGELYYRESGQSSVTFVLQADSLSAALGLVAEEAPE